MSDVLPPRPPVVVPPPTGSRFAKRAAIVSLLAPFVVILIYILSFIYIRSHLGTQGPTFGWLAFGAFVFLPLSLIPAGAALGIASMVLAKRSGHKRVLGMGLVGTWVNGVFLALIIVPALFAGILGPAFVSIWRQLGNP
jgi:hypothetical protein